MISLTACKKKFGNYVEFEKSHLCVSASLSGCHVNYESYDREIADLSNLKFSLGAIVSLHD